VPIRAELRADKERGPGHALLRIAGVRASATVEFALERSQGTTPYLGRGGVWQATEAWHSATETTRVDDAVVAPIGPDLVDAIVQQGTAVTFRLWVATETTKESTTLAVHRPLLGSRAAAPYDVAAAPAAAQAPTMEISAEAIETPATIDTVAPDAAAPPLPPMPPEPAGRRWPWIGLSLAVLALAGLGIAAWYRCWIPGFGAADCSEDVATAPEERGGPAAPAGSGRSCTGLDGARCLEVARAALAAGELETARQLLQQASQLGSVEANTDMARMYDPQTWKADTSPVPQPDWETAAYWYETAARQNDPAGQLGAGRLLCTFAPGEFERQRGLAYLRAAANAGRDEAKPLVAECEKQVTP